MQHCTIRKRQKPISKQQNIMQEEKKSRLMKVQKRQSRKAGKHGFTIRKSSSITNYKANNALVENKASSEMAVLYLFLKFSYIDCVKNELLNYPKKILLSFLIFTFAIQN